MPTSRRQWQAGLAFAPGPLMVALLSGPAGGLAGRIGRDRRPSPARSCSRPAARGGSGAPARRRTKAADLLPGIVVGGIGVSLVFPVLAGAAVSGLPPERAATGSALFNMARQIGGVIGVAAVVAILGGGALEAGDFRAAWAFMAAAALASGVAALRIPGRFARRPAGVALGRPSEEDQWQTTSRASGAMRPATCPGCAPSTASSSATAPPAAGSSAAA